MDDRTTTATPLPHLLLAHTELRVDLQRDEQEGTAPPHRPPPPRPKARGMTDADADAWFRSPPSSPRAITNDDPLRVIVAGGGLAGLVTAAACTAKGMKVAVFEQASAYAPYGGPIQIQSNALRALQRINPTIYEELVKAGTCTADRVSGLKIGYRRGNKLAGIYDKVGVCVLVGARELGIPPHVEHPTHIRATGWSVSTRSVPRSKLASHPR